MDRLLIVVMVLTAIIHLINTLIYAVRPAGVATKKLATAYSLFNVIFLIAQTANMIQAPLIGSIVDHAIKRAQESVGTTGSLVHSAVYRQELDVLNSDIRLVILAASVGTALGALFIPAFIGVFQRGIQLFEEVKSVPRMFTLVLFSPRRLKNMLKSSVALPEKGLVKQATKQKLNIPRKFLVLNFFVTGIYTIGVLSALYAGALFPDFRSIAIQLSGIINGMATIMFATVVDPTAAMITDQALREERPPQDVKHMSFYLALTRLGGTVFAQLIFVPAALIIKWVAEIIARGF